MNKCDNCGSVHSDQWHDDHKMIIGEYSVTCSEPNAPIYVSVPIKICNACMEEYVYLACEAFDHREFEELL